MEIVNCHGARLPISQVQLPRKVIGFKRIYIAFIDRNAITFLHHFRQLFTACPIDLIFHTTPDRILDFILRNIWPMIGKNICAMHFFAKIFHNLRKFIPSILNDFPSLRVITFIFDECFIEFPCDDNAAASDGQLVAKWLFTPLQNDVPKVLKYWSQKNDENLASKIEAFKTAFGDASSPVNFIVVVSFPLSFTKSVVPFALTNELTREQLALKRINNSHRFVFVRCPIARDESK